MGLINIRESNFDAISSELVKNGAKSESSFYGDQGGSIDIVSGGAELTIWFDKNGVIDQLEINNAKVEIKNLKPIN